ncbi:hypothetical protein [Vibrio cholerae]|uniref:Phage protein n=2 Tax=Vibrio cholerae TaxID=666 RepID=A0A655SCM7_VIBCL|nr:hypothetical protein [Vibrio cholerae]ABQ18915.1 conserved hypothetical protein [Vibrio cholerae O395]ACP11078.1 hypothetical protein VC395_A0235 [Vibrio cholerae O395]APF69530.1 hypothetical protein ASZ88_03190 [Vibrio cholerae]EEY42482.1 hypothetical protein VIJ_001045 [Vibrio cholerae RC27]EGR0473743.1 hypothetical protein [Vibrio cholerae]
MKLTKRLFISNEEYELADNKVSLKLSLGGKAIFIVTTTTPPERFALVRFDIGYEQQTAPFFEGFIDKVEPASNGAFRLIVKELSGILSNPLPISIEHPTMADIFAIITKKTGLEFRLPEADYTKKVIPNFVNHGDGYQCLDKIGKAFQVPDFVWYQDTDQVIYFGAYEHSHFYNKPMSIPHEFTSKQSSNSVTFAPFPMLRPGRVAFDKRITKLELFGDEMTAFWTDDAKPAKKRELDDMLPEVAAGYHLPIFGRVEAVRDSATAGQVADPFRPRFAIDVQVLNEDMQPDENIPVYRSIPLPVHMSGHESGLMAYPLEGTIVEIAFAYGRSDLPLIRGIYGRDYALPTIAPGEQLQQQREEVSRRIDAAGNITDQTDQTFTSKAFKQAEHAHQYTGEFGQHQLLIDEHSLENIIGKKLIEALGAIEMLAGDNIELGSLGNMHVATAGELIEVIGKVRRSIAAEHQWLQSPKTWLGSKQENVLILLSELMQVVKELADTLATHTHGGVMAGPAATAAPNQASDISDHGSDSAQLKARLDPITKQ